MGIPLYGQETDGNVLKALTSGLKMMKISVAVTTSGNANNSQVSTLPAGCLPVFSVAHNNGSVALASNACVLDIPDINAAFHITGELNALAAGGTVAYMVDGDGGIAESNVAGEEILIDGSSGLVVASGSTTLDVYVWYVDGPAVAADSLSSAL